MSAFFASTEEKIAVQNLGTLFISCSLISKKKPSKGEVSAWTKSSYRLLEHCRKAARSSKWWFWRGVQFKKLTFSFLNWTPLQNSSTATGAFGAMLQYLSAT
ncbi:MAG: hypothetical protein NXI23_26400 [Bacteroidetes bacterium]|nr:hypothetical protein [Bacteroidota bacterium]